MKTLLKKEFTFTAIPLSYFFLLAGILAFVPGYPILCGPFFICLGIFYSFQIAREGNDALYTSLLPVKKCDVVRARFLWVITIEMIGFVIMAVITVIRMTLLVEAGPYVNNALMNANFMFLGFVFLIYAAFNGLFCRGFWKDAYRIGVPFLQAGIMIFVMIAIAEAIHHIPGMSAMNTPFGFLNIQISVLVGGFLVFLSVSFLSCKASMNSFEKLDLHL